MGKRKWNAATSGKAMKQLRERAGLDKREVATRLGVHIRAVGAWEDGIEPRQDVMAQLDELYELDEQDWEALYPTTAAAQDAKRDYAERRADLSKRVATLDEGGWRPR